MPTPAAPEKIKLLIDGEEAFPQIVKRIRSAKKSIFINIFIWRDDNIGNIIAKELLDAANRGCKIFISKDALGALFEKAEQNKQSFFHKENRFPLFITQKVLDLFYHVPGEAENSRQVQNPLALSFINHKNIKIEKDVIKHDHSKYYIFDDEIIILGGMNIDDRDADSDVSGTKWNNYMCEIIGEEYVNRFKTMLSGRTDPDGVLDIDFVVNSRKSNSFRIKPKILELLSAATKNVFVEMAYLGDKEIINKIIETADRGIKIFVVMPHKANVQSDFNLKIIKEVLLKSQRKITVYLCKNMIHSKAIVFDEESVLIGSANLNKVGMDRTSEADLLISKKYPLIAKMLLQNIKKHFSISTAITDPSQVKFSKFRAFIEGFYA